MKRYGNLKQLILSDQNIIQSELNARRGKSSTYGVKRFDKNPELTLDKIKKDLSDCTYKTSKYHIFKIYEPKERLIYLLPYYPDRIVHHILMNILEPIFVKWFIKDSYSCIKGRGLHKMVSKIERSLFLYKLDTAWCLKLDIRKFYPSIDQDILISILKTKIKDKWVIKILSEIIYSTTKGVPIGNYLSLFFANIYLNKIDHWIKETLRIKFYYRYCDDIVIFGNDPKNLYKIYRLINLKLSFINLRLKKPRIFLTQSGVDFAGYVFKQTFVLIRKKLKIRFKRAVIKYNKTNKLKYKRKISSYYGWIIHCDGIRLLKINILSLYYEFKKHYFKHCGIRTYRLERRRKITTVR